MPKDSSFVIAKTFAVRICTWSLAAVVITTSVKADVRVYPHPGKLAASSKYEVHVFDGSEWVDSYVNFDEARASGSGSGDESGKSFSWTTIETTDATSVRVRRLSGPFGGVVIRPKRHGIAPKKIATDTVEFTIQPGQKLSVEFDSEIKESCDDYLLLGSHPIDEAKDVHVSASIHLRFSDAMDAATLKHLRLFQRTGDKDVEVAVQYSTDLTQASITVSPRQFLKPNTDYVLTGDTEVRSRAGDRLQPFRLNFQTGRQNANSGNRLVFTATTIEKIRSLTTVSVGPDRRLYGGDAFGNLYRWKLTGEGMPAQREVIWQDARKSRQIIDLEWDPRANAERLVLWVSYAERLPPDEQRRFFTGTISRLTIDRDVQEEPMVVGLPHGREKQGGFDTLPHQPNGLAFRNGLLYQSIGSTSSSGGPPNWGIAEQPLSACVIEIDVRRIKPPLDVHPSTKYDPTAEDAPLRLFATGIRNALELVTHPNGQLYTGVNQNDRRGQADGVPDHPGIPGDQNRLITSTTPDHESLLLVQRGRHYGFPNPSRRQYVLAGGNPTSKPDPFEIPEYPVGTQPDDGFALELMFPIWQFGGTSPNGGLAYDAPQHPLHRHLIWCFYSTGDIAVIPLSADGLPTTVEKLRTPPGKLQLSGPLDITQDTRTGNLYIADFGKQSKFGADGSLVLLRPAKSSR